jgi:hypothetical protein
MRVLAILVLPLRLLQPRLVLDEQVVEGRLGADTVLLLLTLPAVPGVKLPQRIEVALLEKLQLLERLVGARVEAETGLERVL